MARWIAALALLTAFAAAGAAAVLAVEQEPEPRRPQPAAPGAIDARSPTGPAQGERPRPAREKPRQVRYRDSTALGTPAAGALRRGVKFPRQGRHHFTWDPVKRLSPSPSWRRWGTDDLVRTVLRVVRDYARSHPGAPRVGIGDLSRRRGGDFTAAVSGGIGHATHQNGLDADVYYPLRSGAERAPLRVSEIRLRLAQDLVDRFVAAGAAIVYVGPSTGLTGPPGVVVPAANHDNHLHARIPPGA